MLETSKGHLGVNLPEDVTKVEIELKKLHNL